MLEEGKKQALKELADHPNRVDQSRMRYVGLGYAVAKGWAVYRGNGVFVVTDAGLRALERVNNGEET